METVGHRLTDKDFTAGTATCAICGPVKMRSRGKGRAACAVNLAARRRRWTERNPQQARRNRRSRSDHKLTTYDASTRTGECPLCGTVAVVPKGRGWMCRVRFAELWAIEQDVPQGRCSVCRRTWLSADGTCSYCSSKSDLSHSMRVARFYAAEKQWTEDACDTNLDFIVDERKHDPLSTEGEQVENPALKTIGSGVPDGRRSEWFIRDWWAKNGHLVEGE